MKTPLRLAGIAGFVLVWGGLIFGSTRLHGLELFGDCSICGPWGCGPPLNSLVGAHCLWTSLLAPLVGLACRMLAGPMGVRLAKGALAIGGAILVGLFLVSATSWFRVYGADYAVQRGLFVVALTPDAMGLPLLAGGAFGLLAARKPKSIAGMHGEPVETPGSGRENLAV